VPVAQFLPDLFLVSSIVQRLVLIELRHGIDRPKKRSTPYGGKTHQ
jgi:hypothetical protein